MLASCGNDGPATDESGRLAVAAAFYPLAELVRAVGGDVVEVTTIVPPGEEAHEYEPSPKQLTELSRACLLYTSPSPRNRTRSRMPTSA